MHKTLIASAALALLITPGVRAQDNGPEPDAQPPIADATANSRLRAIGAEEITVTARKKDENLQDVPISITAFTAETLRAKNINDAYDIADNTPNFSFTQNLGRRLDVPNIRGQFGPLIGSTAPNASFFVDGVYVAGSIGSTSTANLERVEVLRGPQSALFGRATFSGAVNYITRKPTDEFLGEANAKYGEDGRKEFGIWASGPLVEDKLYFFAGGSVNKWDGEWRNGLQPGQVNSAAFAGPFGAFIWRGNAQFPGDPPCPPGSNPGGCAYTVGDNTELGGEETRVGTLKLTFTPLDELEVNVKYERSEADDDHFAYLFVPPTDRNNCFRAAAPGDSRDWRDPIGNPPPPPLDPGAGSRSGSWICGELNDMNYVSVLNLPNFTRGVTVAPPTTGFVPTTVPPAPFLGLREGIDRYLIEGIYDIGEYTVTARFAGEDRKSEYVRDLDRSYALGPIATGLFEGYELQEDKQDSFELRIASPTDGDLSWSLGYYYYDQDSEGFGRDFTGFSRITLQSTGTNQVKNKAVFGSIEYQITEELTATFDGRYASDTIARQSSASSVEDTFYSFSPRFSLRWFANENLTAYFQAAEGNKPGGFNFSYFDAGVDPDELIRNADKTRIKEEKAWTYEVGAKGSFFDDEVTAGIALFYIDWTNQAINIQECIKNDTDANPALPPCELNNIVTNAGESRVLGMELEGTWFATDNLLLTLGYGYTDSKLEEFVDDEYAVLRCPEACYELLPNPDWSPGDDPALQFLEDFTANAKALRAALGDVSGNAAPRVPKHNLSFSALYQRAITGDVDWFWRNDWLYESKRYSTSSNLAWAPERWNWNTRLGLESENWTVALYINNLTNEKSPVQIQDFPLFDGSVGVGVIPATGFEGLDAPVNLNAFSILPRQTRNVGITGQIRF